jgi:hypothetical protein
MLAATITTPTVSNIAIDMIAKALASGVQPAARTYCDPVSYPALGRLPVIRDAVLV